MKIQFVTLALFFNLIASFSALAQTKDPKDLIDVLQNALTNFEGPYYNEGSPEDISEATSMINYMGSAAGLEWIKQGIAAGLMTTTSVENKFFEAQKKLSAAQPKEILESGAKFDLLNYLRHPEDPKSNPYHLNEKDIMKMVSKTLDEENELFSHLMNYSCRAHLEYPTTTSTNYQVIVETRDADGPEVSTTL
jgi:hypothetical protein